MGVLGEIYHAMNGEDTEQRNVVSIVDGVVRGNLNPDAVGYVYIKGRVAPNEELYDMLTATANAGHPVFVTIGEEPNDVQYNILCADDVKDVFRVLDMIADGLRLSNS